ncbi:MAG: anhydro-N-acetylmuramic acid kinase [Phycisphaerae bacterium]|nr:anhydro-N-acetylmuramic acid kinase [Phycisphaerae bacterium]
MTGIVEKLGAKSNLRVVGLMSGTSADGVDAAITDFGSGRRIRVKAFATYPYSRKLRRQVLDLAQARCADVDEICHLNFVLGEVFADAVVRLATDSGIDLGSIDLIGSHGQTIRHLPAARRFRGRKVRSTLQIGEPSVIAERTGITTVADFRPRDIAAGGHGAPLVPYADWLLFAHRRRSRAVQNIGGIANVTYLPAGAKLQNIVAMDTGPGNMVIDCIMQRITAQNRRFDSGGAIAARGKVSHALLGELMKHPYLRRRPPKTTGREEFGRTFSDALFDRGRADGLGPEDILATATAFTAESIAKAYRRFVPGPIDEVILCGGGSRNSTLVAMLRDRLREARLTISDAHGLDAEGKEAVCFAILARETICGRVGNVPAATGASGPVVLGKIVLGKVARGRRP